MQLKVQVVQGGKLKPLKLTTEQYRQLGQAMLDANKRRIKRGINADGQTAKPLSKKYRAIKRKVRGVTRPIRDMWLTGTTLNSYQVVRAYGGIIRAEPRGAEGRRRAWAAQRLEPMFGFTPFEEKAVVKEARAMFGRTAQLLWEKQGKGVI